MRHYVRYFILLFLIILTIQKIESIELEFDHLTVDDGLPTQSINEIFQDSHGFIWVATDNGLVRYDGYEFKCIQDRSDNPAANQFEKVQRIIPSSYFPNSLWIGTRGGIYRYCLKTEKFVYYFCRDVRRNSTISSDAIWSLCESKRGGLWIATYLGIDYLDYKTDEFTHFLGDTCVKVLYEDADSMLWIGSYLYGLIRLDPTTGKKTVFKKIEGDPESLSNNNVESIFESRLFDERILWIGTRSGLNKFNLETEKFVPILNHNKSKVLNTIYISGIHQTRQSHSNVLWLSGNKLRLYDPQLDSMIQFVNNVDDPTSISSNTVTHIIEDRSGIIWISSNNGLNIYNPFKKPFQTLLHRPNDPTSISSNYVTAIHQINDDELWVGTSNGVNLVNRKTNQVSSVYLPGEYIQSINIDRSGIVWIGSARNLYEFDLSSEKLIAHYDGSDKSNGLKSSSIRDIYIDNSNTLYLATGNGFYQYQRDKGVFRQYISLTNVSSIIQSSNNENIFWLGGTIFGLVKLDIRTGYYIDYMKHPFLKGSISSNQVYTLMESDEGDVWLGTTCGLNRLIISNQYPDSNKVISFTANVRKIQTFHRDSCGAFFDDSSAGMYYQSPIHYFRCYDDVQGFSTGPVTSMLYDHYGNLWLGTIKGLVKLNPELETARNYNVGDGLPSNQFFPQACYKSGNGELFYGTMNGLVYFFPDSIKENTHVPYIRITGIRLFHKPIYSTLDLGASSRLFQPVLSVDFLDTLYLNYKQNTISLEFTALDFHNSIKNQYAYRLIGMDEDWIYTSSENRLATYTNLNPGEYLFKVKGSNNDGIWNDEGQFLTIIINPPWWRSLGAYISYVLLLIGAIYSAWQFQMSRVRLRHQVELEHLETERYQEIDRLKSRFFANISHEFRTPLTLILGPIDKLRNRIHDNESLDDLYLMNKHARRLLNLISQLLDLSKLEARKMKLKTSCQDIIPLITGLVQSFGTMAERKGISLSFQPEIDNLELYFQKDAIVKIMNNLLSNAFKFCNSGDAITISIYIQDTHYKPDFVCIKVADTGMGIPADRLNTIFNRFYQVDDNHVQQHEGTGIGLSLTKELVELHKGSISVESVENVGSTFTIRLPLGKDHLDEDEIVEKIPDTDTDIIKPDLLVDDSEESNKENGSSATWESTWEVLIVEDNADVSRYIREYLEHDYHVIEARNGEEGFAKAMDKIPDLIISDIMMPVMDGVEFCRKIRTDERTSHIPIILLTAKAELDDKLNGLETGADDYLTKPFEARELQMRIKNLIEQRQRLQNRFKKEFSIIPDDISLTSIDQQFINKVIDIIKENLANSDFKIDDFAHQIYMSRQHLNRKLKALTGFNPSDFVRSIRLKTAAQLLRQHEATITEIAYQVGFASPSRFSEYFRREFGCTPKQFSQKD